MIIIAVVGQPSSGKDTVAGYLASEGFANISSGDRIRKDMQRDGIRTTRENINAFVIEARRKYGLEYPANLIVKEINGNAVVSGLRNTAEVRFFKQTFGGRFILMAVYAPQETRFRWAKERGRIGDEVSFEEFRRIEEKERGGSNFHEVDAVIKMADFAIQNDGTKEELFRKLDAILEQHPKWIK